MKTSEELKNCLEQGETMLWSGSPEAFTPNDQTHKKGFVKRAIISLLVGAVLSIGYVIAAKATSLKPAVFVILWAICIYAIFSEQIGCNKIKKMMYGLTDRRVVLLNDGTLTGFEYASVDTYEFKKDDDGHNCLLVGKNAVELDMYKWRLVPVEPILKNIDTGVVEKAGFYAIPDIAEFKKIFEQNVKN